jgi:signal transduction histidine kinase
MNADSLEKTSFTRILLIFFSIGCGFILLFETAEQLDFIGKLAESFGRLLVWTVLLVILAYVARRVSLEQKVWIAGVTCGLFILIGLLFGVTEDIQQLDAVPLIGHDSDLRKFIEKAVICGWSCSILFLVFYLVRSLERGHNSLRAEVRERTRALEQLQEAEHKALQRERLSALGEMASGVAHDLNNALSPVVIYCELLQAGVADDEREAMLENVMQGALQAAGIVEQLQFFYRDSDAANPHESVDLVSIVRETVSLTKPKWHDDAVHFGIDISISLDLPGVALVSGDAVELKQLLTNLVLNAVDAVPDGGTIAIRIINENVAIRLEVEDDGIGMSDIVRDRCFEPFFTQKKRNGSGLGLSVCHGIVKRHKGTIEVESAEGKGTRFRITLPLGREATTPGRIGRQPCKGSEKQVLYIDDERKIRDSTACLLRALGASVDVASDGAEGLRMISQKRYDLVITDLGMSGMQGRQVLRTIKAQYANVPVAIVSGWSATEVASEFVGALQPDQILQKPVTMAKMQHALSTLAETR